MTDAITESWKLSDEFINVKYKAPEKAVDLLIKCNKWLENFICEEKRLRKQFKGSTMLSSQLDLNDLAKERVRCIKINCEQIIIKLKK